MDEAFVFVPMRRGLPSIVLTFAIGVACNDQRPTLGRSSAAVDNPVAVSNPSQAPPEWELATTEQAETAVATAQLPVILGGTDVVIVAYNDHSRDLTRSPIEYEWLPDNEAATSRSWNRPVSQLGWSRSVDFGASFTYRGKIMPPAGFSGVWGDPSIAVDPSNLSTVYLASLGISDLAWQDTSVLPPASESPARHRDSICSSRSTDAGNTFTPRCFRVTATLGAVDNTAIVVDHFGVVYWASRFGTGPTFSRLFRSTSSIAWDNFSIEMQPADTGGGASHAIRLRRDDDGFVYFSEAADGMPDALRINVTRSDATPSNSWLQTLDIETPGRVPPDDFQLPNGEWSRVEGMHDFQVSHDSSNQRVLKVVYVRMREDGRRYLALTSCILDGQSPPFVVAKCDIGVPLTESYKGVQWMPSVSVERRLSDEFAWRVAYLTTEMAEPSIPEIRVEGAVLLPSNDLNFHSDLVGVQPYCPRHGGTSEGYWGDYFGSSAVFKPGGFYPYRTLAAFSDSRDGCQKQTEVLSRHLHVAANRFPF